MPKIIFVRPDGSRLDIEAAAGQSLMESAIAGGVSGIVGECGGACQCATCHVYVSEPWRQRLTPVSREEDAMLDNTLAERRPESRLTCQIKVTAQDDGLVVFLPERQV